MAEGFKALVSPLKNLKASTIVMLAFGLWMLPDLIAIGAYQRGNDAATDEALERWPEILEFLGQDVSLAADLPHSLAALKRLVESENVP